MQISTITFRCRGFVAVPSGTVTSSDIAHVDATAQMRLAHPSINEIQRECLYYEIDGRKVSSPLGLPARQLECVWKFTVDDSEGLLASILPKK